jgi:hypothetical protein
MMKIFLTNPRLICAIVGLALLVGRGAAAPASGFDPAATFQRVVHARMYDGATWTAGQHQPGSLADLLVDLRPTLVSGLVRMGKNDKISDELVNDHHDFRAVLFALKPTPRLDIVLNAAEYHTAEELVGKMRALNKAIPVQQWFFESFDTGFKGHADVLEAAVAYAHAQGQAVGGTVAGAEAPKGADYLAVSDARGREPMFMQLKALERHCRLPILVHVHNGVERGDANGNEEWARIWTGPERRVYLTDLARSQEAGHYRLMYPVFYPEIRKGNSYDAWLDRSWPTLLGIMKKYNPIDFDKGK